MSMSTMHGRSLVRTAILATCAAAVTAAAAGTALASAATSRAPRSHTTAAVAASGLPVVINCVMHPQTRPASYVLACADGNSYVAKMSWASWESSAAFGSGTDTFNDCVPSCVAGHFHSFPALVALWRVEALPGHPGDRYFTRLTIIYTGSRSYMAGGHEHELPQTVTYPLSAGGGA